MGCCCSSETESPVQDAYSDERSRLLPDSPSPTIEYGNGHDVHDKNYGTTTEKLEEHSSHSKILNKAAGKLIDIGAPECQPLEEHEYGDRTRIYAQKLNRIRIPEALAKQYSKPTLLIDVPSVEKFIDADPVYSHDYKFMHRATDNIVRCLGLIKVDCEEPVVIPFGYT